MKYRKWIANTEQWATIFELTAILIILLMTFILQFVLHELPCPLCLLQRVGFLSMGFGFLLNLRFGFKPSHYSIVLISGLFTCFVALRQIALHVVPGTGAYGSAIFGIHLYTWSFIAAIIIVIMTILLMSVDRQYVEPAKKSKSWKKKINLLFAAFILLITANIVSVIFECGLKACPDNPVRYELSI
ncbi:MAG: hypothetical protein ACD_46C00161G0003 [uncultured bacterium]|nr:MAG: hypothetical protein ACD_46C00161G0003 [uncultured bacterium]